MVQKQAALSGGYRADTFADDDPLAELARIVGFEQPRPGQRSTPETQPQAPSPVFNLEDELLKEFETFEVPAPRTTQPVAPAQPVQQVAAPVVQAPIAQAPVAKPTVMPEPVVAAQPVKVQAPAVLEEPFDWADELAQAEYYEVAPQAPEQVVAREQAVSVAPQIRQEPAQSLAPAARQEPSFDAESADDLINELELAFGTNTPAAPEPAWAPQPAAAPRISLPIANFQAKPAARPEPDFGPDFVDPEPVRHASFVEAPRRDGDYSASPAPAFEPEADDAWLDFGNGSTSEPSNLAASDRGHEIPGFEIDPPQQARFEKKPEAGPIEPDFSFSFADELAASEEVAFTPEAPRAWQPEIRESRQSVAPAVATPSAKPAEQTEDFDLLGDNEFELMLDDLDLDLSELDFVEPAKARTVTPPPVSQPVKAAAQPQPSIGRATVAAAPVMPRSTPSAVPAASAAPFVAASAAPAFGTRAPAAIPAKPAGDDFDFRMAFDPDEIVEQEEQPETVAMMDVPDVVYTEPKEPAPRRSDFEYDIETELAGLFEAPTASPVTAAAADTVTFGGPAVSKPAAADDFDAFERALEEDFRRSLQNPSKGKMPPAGRISLDQVAAPRRRSGRPLALALVATVVVVGAAAAGGAYFWLGTGSSATATSGEPRVIMADKDPIKVAPENPGGKSVPNQDKAVYDRVAGSSVADPKQSSLISTNEEPVDVVQRTLLPENLPLEGESEGEPEAMGTPVGETSDPRLLPEGQQTADAAANGEADQSAIAPRKVRTMIVRPDGTLVAQEVPAEAPAASAPAASAPAAQTSGRPAAPAATPAAAPAAAAPAASAPAPTQVAAAPAQQPAASAPAASSTPVPNARPAEQPVNVVGRVTDQGNVTATRNQPAAPAPAAAPAAAQPASAPAQASVPAGSYVIQIASLPSEADAQASYRNLSAKFSGVIGGRGVDIKAAEVAGKGTYYRVRIPAGTKAEAEALCGRYKAAGGSCLVAR
ncbi:SPOR domain-containing protein [Rhizobium sp. RU36D]|uniref:SPOR domain-containing protein n=1 Tax=Rhizobium sp. RU36D TaxID=1907415 RepID=UPI0009D8E506|nr:SPOR domain-containing protein [Rhizobium sp. RU36D]SMC64568.1 Sporulation related domain-containing protein [Rhizobium sp. RU36D]